MKVPKARAKAGDQKEEGPATKKESKQFDKNAEILRKDFIDTEPGKEDEVALPTYNDVDSIDEFISSIAEKSDMKVLAIMCKENKVAMGRSKADRVKALLMHQVDDDE